MNLMITGSTGIAAATARLAARRGEAVFIVGIDLESCQRLVRELSEQGATCDFYLGDLRDEKTAIVAIEKCLEKFSRIDALFNVAGISGRQFGDGPVHECTSQGWEMTFEANLKTTFLMCREVVRRMLKQDIDRAGLRGAILNMSSVLSDSPEPDFFSTHAYAASKGAIVSLTKSMASYYARHKIRVNALAPGLTRTPMSRRAQENQAIREFIETKQPLPEDLIDPNDVAEAAIFLLSDASRNITGQTLKIDGGWSVV